MRVTEIARLLVSLSLLGLAGGLYYFGFKNPEISTQIGMTNTASAIIGANLTYWLRPEGVKEG